MPTFGSIDQRLTIQSIAYSLACASDFHNRYFFESEILWGDTAFIGSQLIKNIHKDILIPLLKDFTHASYVNVRPLSGLHCMLIVISTYCKPGDVIFTVPPLTGGHASTSHVASKLSLSTEYIPFINSFEVDYNKFSDDLKRLKPKLVYIDQAHCLFPLNFNEISKIIRHSSASTFLHVDSSHTNGLIFGGALPNPLDQGADSFGGSTHKTFPGPQKAFIATFNLDLANSFEENSMYLVSHYHTGSAVALAISLLEFQNCNGADYAKNIIKHSKLMANVLYKNEIKVQAYDKDFTETHQIWIDPKNFGDPRVIIDMLYEAGIYINAFPLPGIDGIGFRLGLNEPTRYGLDNEGILVLTSALIDVIKYKDVTTSKAKIVHLKKNYIYPAYCYTKEEIDSRNTSIISILKAIENSYES